MFRNSPSSDWRAAAMLFVVVLSVNAVVLLLNVGGDYGRLRLDGDEGHYLNMTRALAIEGTLDPEEIYDLSEQERMLPANVVLPIESLPLQDGRHVPVHRSGLAFVLAPGFLIAGVPGAAATLSFAGAVFSVVAFLLSRAVVKSVSKLPEWWAALLLSITVPAILFSFHFYSEMIAAILLAIGLWAIVRGQLVVVLIGMSAGLLPFFNLRYLTLSAGLLVGAILLLRRRDAMLAVPVAALTLVFARSVEAALGGAFFNMIGEGADSYLSLRFLFGPGLLGSLFDQQWGIVPVNPLYLAGFAGLAGALLVIPQRVDSGPSFVSTTRGAVVGIIGVVAPYAGSIVLFNQWHGGLSPTGRFVMPLGAVVVVGLAYGLAYFRGCIWRVLVVLAIAAAISVAIAYTLKPDLRLPTGDFATRHRIVVMVGSRSINLLPNLKNPNDSHVVPVVDTVTGWLWLAGSLMIVTGILGEEHFRSRRRLLPQSTNPG